MIDIQVRIHDKFSIELKIGHIVSNKPEPDEFAVNMWFFIPNSLDINSQSYGKDMFYRDLKSNVRLITPVFLLREIVAGQAIPYKNLEASFRRLAADPEKPAIEDYEYNIKMFMAILKSASRDEITHIINNHKESDISQLCSRYLENMTGITHAYRQLRDIIDVHTVPSSIFEYFLFGDEFMGSIVEQQTFKLLKTLEQHKAGIPKELTGRLKELINSETNYRIKRGFPVTEIDSPTRNREVIYRQGVLKRYIESDLFLSANVKRDGVAMEQLYFSIAAGISMIFATAVAFSFQQKYGNFTMPLFVALVVSYMLKDRIKEIMRYWFAHKLKDKYFDNKISVSIKGRPIGWIKEGFDFIAEEKVPPQVMEIRSRSSLLQAENRFDDEKIILFRRLVHLDSQVLREEDKYSITGINNIIRLHLTSFIQKMDNPKIPLSTITDDGTIGTVYGDKIYYMNMVIQLKHEEQLEYKRYRMIFNREGIMDIESLK